MKLFKVFLLLCFIICALAVSFTKDLLTSIIIFMSYSLNMAVIWVLLQSPDLVIAKAAAGAGVTSVLFFTILREIWATQKEDDDGRTEK